MKLPLRIRLGMWAFHMSCKWTVFKLSFSCWLWELRGLTDCPYHGTHAQSLINGYCKECGEIPHLPPMDEICCYCTKEKAVLQRANPNGGRDIWSVCWECNKFIDWGFEQSWYHQAEAMGLDMTLIKKVKEFPEWLFDHEQVYPKHDYSQFILRKIDTNGNS